MKRPMTATDSGESAPPPEERIGPSPGKGERVVVTRNGHEVLVPVNDKANPGNRPGGV